MRHGTARAKKPEKRDRDPLLSAICHDLRAPLAAVTMGASFVLQTAQRADENARSVKILEAMLRSCSQMERLIRNFADLSEIEAGAVALKLAPADANEVLDVGAERLAETASSRNVTIEVSKIEGPLTVLCDRDRLQRAFGQLVDNAVKLAPGGSVVTLSAADRETSIALTVTDRGAGITPQMRRNLFDREWHAKRANRGGPGFGLAIAKGFVTAHGGKLVVDSRPQEETSFTMVLPKAGPRRG